MKTLMLLALLLACLCAPLLLQAENVAPIPAFDVFSSPPTSIPADLCFDVFTAPSPQPLTAKPTSSTAPMDSSAFDVFGLPPAVSVRRLIYPVRPKETWWTNCPTDKPGLIEHLTSGAHAGRFDKSWLQTLTIEELQSLHSDNHDFTTRWDAVVQPKPTAIATKQTQAPAPSEGCGWRWVNGQRSWFCR